MGKCTRDSRDTYYRSAKQEGWRARSAFKLLNLDKSLNGFLFKDVNRAVDLCAAPGSWSQVLSQQIYQPNTSNPDVKIVAVDFQFMVPIPGVTQFQGDITQVATAERILAEFKGEKADLVVCDGAPDVTGLHDLDIYRHHDIVIAALAITTAVLKENGTMVMKVFKKKEDNLLVQQISSFFRRTSFIKPEGSRDSSLEHFAVGFQHYCPSNYSPRMLLEYLACAEMDSYRHTLIPFIIYGEITSTKCQPESLPCNNHNGNKEKLNEKEKISDVVSQRMEQLNVEEGEVEDNERRLEENAEKPRKSSTGFVWKSHFPSIDEIISVYDKT